MSKRQASHCQYIAMHTSYEYALSVELLHSRVGTNIAIVHVKAKFLLL